MRHKGTDTETELRHWLLADRVEFRKQMCVTLAEDPTWSARRGSSSVTPSMRWPAASRTGCTVTNCLTVIGR